MHIDVTIRDILLDPHYRRLVGISFKINLCPRIDSISTSELLRDERSILYSRADGIDEEKISFKMLEYSPRRLLKASRATK